MWYPRTTPKALEFGVAFHAAMEVYYDPETWFDRTTAAQLALVKFNEVVKEQLSNYKKLNGEPEAELLQDYKERVELGTKMIKYYTSRVSPLLDEGLTPIATEVPFEVPLGFNCTCDRCWQRYYAYAKEHQLYDFDKVYLDKYGTYRDLGYLLDHGNRKVIDWEGLPVTYGGRIDAVFQDSHGRVWPVDWKSSARILDEDAESSFLELDDQVTSYCVGLWRLGKPVAGFIYHEQRKSVPEPPEELTRLYKGRKFSTSKTASTDYNTFLATVMKEDLPALEAGCYDDYIHWLKTDGPKYFQRHQVHRNERQLENAWRDMVEEAKDIVNNPRVYPMPGRFSCPTCAYRQPCLGMNHNEDYEYTLASLFEKRTKHYYETEEDKTK